jgi:hypothetical protein
VKTAPLWKIKWGNLITGGKQNFGTAKRSGLTCRIDSFEYAPDLEANIALVGALQPMVTRISLTLTPFHDHTVGSINQRYSTKFPYNTPNSRFFKGDLESSRDAHGAVMGDHVRIGHAGATHAIDTGLMRLTMVKIEGKYHYYIFTRPEGGEHGEYISNDLAHQLMQQGYKVSESDPRMFGTGGWTSKGPSGKKYKVEIHREGEAYSSAQLKNTSEGRKVLEKLKQAYLKRIQERGQY